MNKANILAFTKYSYEGPSSRYRFYNYRECFFENNIQLVISPLFDRPYFKTNSKLAKALIVFKAYLKRVFLVFHILFFKRKYDLVLIEYELLPYLPACLEYLLAKRNIKYIVDYDDAIFHKYDMHKNPLARMFLKKKIGKVMQYAQYMIVCNAYLEAYAKKHNTSILRLPTVVLLDRYKQAMENFRKKDTGPFVIGWIGSKSTSIYIVEILPAILKFVEKHEDVRFDLVGFDKSLLSEDETRKHHLNIIPWSEESEIENILAFDVGIMPLHDDPWSRGKCGFKLIQYMSCKKPVVASPVGINKELVSEGVNGFFATKESDWLEAFDALYQNKKLRGVMADNNYSKIINEYNHEKNCQKYLKLIGEALLKSANSNTDAFGQRRSAC